MTLVGETGPEALTEDLFLGGRVRLLQPREGYRAGVDPVLLAATVPARTGQSVLDLGCGVGAVALCLAARVPGLALCGVDLLESNTRLAQRNAAINGATLETITADLAALPASLRQRSFDHVVTNPPFFRAGAGPASDSPHREHANAGAVPLAVWIDTALRRLAPRGHLSLIMTAARLPETLAAIGERLGDLRVLPIAGRQGRAAGRVIVNGRKGSRGPFALLPPLVLHAGPVHDRDADDFTPEAAALLRDAAPLPLAPAG